MEKKPNYSFWFLNNHGYISYIYGKEVVRTLKGEKCHFIRTFDINQEYPCHWAKKELSEEEKATFVEQYNTMLKEDYEFQKEKHPEDKYDFTPMTFGEIIEHIENNQKHQKK